MEFTLQDRFAVENKVFDDVCEGIISPSEFLMVQFITRQCCLKKTDSVELSCGFLAKKLGFSRRHIIRYKASLIEKGYITVDDNTNGKTNKPSIIKVYKGGDIDVTTDKNVTNDIDVTTDKNVTNDIDVTTDKNVTNGSDKNVTNGSDIDVTHNKIIEDNNKDKLVYSNTIDTCSYNGNGESQLIDEDFIFEYEEDVFGRKFLTEKSLNNMLEKLRSLSGDEYYDFYTECQVELAKHGTTKLRKAWDDSPKEMKSDSDETITSNDEEANHTLTDDELTKIINQVNSDEVSFEEANERVRLNGNEKQLKRLFAETL